MPQKWTKEEMIRVFEYLIKNNVGLTSHPSFRKLLDRNQNLFANQVTREATSNIAYRSVDFNLEGLKDEEVWKLLDDSEYNELIEENAAAALVKMAEKLGIVH